MLVRVVISLTIIISYIWIYISEKIKNKNNYDIRTILYILFFPMLVFLLDIWNILERFVPEIYHNITDRYDMLSFFGTYISVIISSLLLVIITKKDRLENTRIIQNGQRPYLDVRYAYFDKKILEEKIDTRTIYIHKPNNSLLKQKELDRFVGIEIINTGETVAIIDVNNLKIDIEYTSIEEKDNEVISKKSIINPNIYMGLTRLSLGKGESIHILFVYDEFYNNSILQNPVIKYSKVYYKDLYDIHYIDEARMDGIKQIVLQDNVRIDNY